MRRQHKEHQSESLEIDELVGPAAAEEIGDVQPGTVRPGETHHRTVEYSEAGWRQLG